MFQAKNPEDIKKFVLIDYMSNESFPLTDQDSKQLERFSEDVAVFCATRDVWGTQLKIPVEKRYIFAQGVAMQRQWPEATVDDAKNLRHTDISDK